MRRLIATLAGLSLALATVVACSDASPTPTATPSPTATPTPTSTPVPTPTSTPSPTKEWSLEEVRVDGSTVTVLLRVYAGIDAQVTLDGKPPYRVRASNPGQHVFLNVAPGKHTVEVWDVVGFSETTEVVTSTPTSGNPQWLIELIQRLQSAPVGVPPGSIIQYEYKGQTVYYVPPQCCDIFSDLYDAEGNIIGHPDGGLTGGGDGRVPDFFDERTDGRTVWEDKRTYPVGHVQAPAPIESVEVLVLESFPPQYQVHVVSGLPNGCTTYGGFRVTRNVEAIHIEMVNWHPADPDLACTEQYGLVETWVPLGSDFVSGETYTVEVNGTVETFVAQ